MIGLDLRSAGSVQMVKHFRHCLALDERRVKFRPVCRVGAQWADYGGESHKEVWFMGSHSDVGGGNDPNANPSLSNITFRQVGAHVHSDL
jgi:uncharacterized protein (DUF2235 family)